MRVMGLDREKAQQKRNLPVAAEGESVVPLPGGPAWSVVVAVALAQTTVLVTIIVRKIYQEWITLQKIRTFLPIAVRPRDSRCL